jgi:threonylcarbamoyladenosine tRNA methylthiotransferase CDKAL1
MDDVDIEEYGKNFNLDSDLSRKDVDKAFVFPKSMKKQSYIDINQEAKINTNLPGIQKIWIKTYGCSHNVSDRLMTDYPDN